MQLVEQGLLDLDVSINQYLPFDIVNPHFPDAIITSWMLLQHRSSLIDDELAYRGLFTIPTGAPDPEMSLQDLARRYYLEGGELYSEEGNFGRWAPGQERSYSNVAFGLLGFLVEQVSGEPFNAYCNKHIFQPLSMTSTGWFSSEVDMRELAVPYDGDVRLAPYTAASYPDGGLRTTVADFSKFMIALTNGPIQGGPRILRAETLNAMRPDRSEDTLVWDPDVFSDFLVDTKDHPVPGHSGFDPGIATLTGFNSLNGRGLIVFMNGSQSLVTPSPFFLWKMINYRAPFRRLAIDGWIAALRADRYPAPPGLRKPP